MSAPFVHLCVHSEYSLANGIVRVGPLVRAAAAAGMPAVAVTDQGNLFAMVKFYRAALAAGVKPLIGVDLRIREHGQQKTPARLILLCQNRTGYLNLTRLVTRSYTEGQHQGVPLLNREWLESATDGLIALSGARHGDIGQALLAGDAKRAKQLLAGWRALFPGRFYIELCRTGREHEEDYLHAAVDLALATDTPVVATNDVHFLGRDDFEAHEARVCVHDGRTLADPRRPRLYTEQQYLRSPQEMAELFADIPEALENTVEIARRCNLELTLGQNALPDFPVPAGTTAEAYFIEQAGAGLDRRLHKIAAQNEQDMAQMRAPYDERLRHELDVIIGMGFPGYFLIVADFIRWARENGIPVGPGRGSGAGSLVAYALGITDLDPIGYDLLFERFLNPERVSLPDFDIDFCMEGRDRVIDYVAQRYGRERVSQIITYGSMAAKAVVRDVGRVLGHPYGFVDQIAKLIPFEIGITLDKALEQEELLRDRYDNEEEVRGLIDLARSLEGLARNAGKHAGGVVIAPSDLTDFTPLYCEQGVTATVTQFDKDDVEAVGLVKFDFLGLRTLTIIDRAVRIVNQSATDAHAAPLDIGTLPMDDKATFDLLKRCATTAVFQLESRGMKDLIKRLQPDRFEDVIALVALFRPGPLQSGMVDDFINRKHGRERVDYPHPDLEPILQPTYGVILYQEQVMQIAQVLAGYSLGGADLLRRAMGKKKAEEMAMQREVFVTGAQGRGIETSLASYIFDLMEKFAGYGFNKSHSAAYALLAYQTAYLKAHYPAAFMAAVLSADMDNTDKVVTLIDECRDMKLTVTPPDVNACACAFTARGDTTILYGLGAIKGVGAAAVEALVEQREHDGAFRDLFDFCCRVDSRKVNRRVIEALIRSGAMDALGPNRASLMASLGRALSMAEKHVNDRVTGQNDLFGALSIGDVAGPAVTGAGNEARSPFIEVASWSEDERLTGEKETLGLYLTGHPINKYEQELAHFTSARVVDLKPTRDQTVVIAGLVVALRAMNSRRGERIAFVTLDDRSGRIEIGVFAECYRTYRDLLAKDRLLVVEGSVSVDEYSGGFRMSAERIMDIDQARAVFAKGVQVNVDDSLAGNGFVQSLARTLQPFREGGCPVRVHYLGQSARADLVLGQEWRVKPTDELLHRLGELAGSDRVCVLY
ncbi:MAG: DNA polymerase III subunit alpha [Gammaproteobacteria bacterium]|nr:MAG: DNA polymerase III subunit alpha [Gammaproteobacteria bacterium]TND07089.1 MAG: DNA polymerase III subunit alpha [Gammaproteobacteria bacterium]